MPRITRKQKFYTIFSKMRAFKICFILPQKQNIVNKMQPLVDFLGKSVTSTNSFLPNRRAAPYLQEPRWWEQCQ